MIFDLKRMPGWAASFASYLRQYWDIQCPFLFANFQSVTHAVIEYA